MVRAVSVHQEVGEQLLHLGRSEVTYSALAAVHRHSPEEGNP